MPGEARTRSRSPFPAPPTPGQVPGPTMRHTWVALTTQRRRNAAGRSRLLGRSDGRSNDHSGRAFAQSSPRNRLHMSVSGRTGFASSFRRALSERESSRETHRLPLALENSRILHTHRPSVLPHHGPGAPLHPTSLTASAEARAPDARMHHGSIACSSRMAAAPLC